MIQQVMSRIRQPVVYALVILPVPGSRKMKKLKLYNWSAIKVIFFIRIACRYGWFRIRAVQCAGKGSSSWMNDMLDSKVRLT